jgi:hypothetical protein
MARFMGRTFLSSFPEHSATSLSPPAEAPDFDRMVLKKEQHDEDSEERDIWYFLPQLRNPNVSAATENAEGV